VIASFQPLQGLIADRVSLEAMFLSTSAFVAVATPVLLVLWLRADVAEEANARPERELEPTAAGS
jgi:hypothetical protein